jgi:hypothetical protein
MAQPRNKAGGEQYWAAVHINLGYLYAEEGGRAVEPGGMRKAAAMFEQATALACALPPHPPRPPGGCGGGWGRVAQAPGFDEAYTYWGNALQARPPRAPLRPKFVRRPTANLGPVGSAPRRGGAAGADRWPGARAAA